MLFLPSITSRWEDHEARVILQQGYGRKVKGKVLNGEMRATHIPSLKLLVIEIETGEDDLADFLPGMKYTLDGCFTHGSAITTAYRHIEYFHTEMEEAIQDYIENTPNAE